jgi:putative transposase
MKKSLTRRTFANKLDREFKQTIPYRVLCTDITYLPYHHRFAYLFLIKNTCHSSQLKDTMIHSDQGFHYTNPSYIEMVQDLNMVQSMSGKGNCIDNAPIESFFGHLKDEVDYQTCKTFNEVYEKIDEYMEYHYHGRRQWDKQKMTLIQYRDHLLSRG